MDFIAHKNFLTTNYFQTMVVHLSIPQENPSLDLAIKDGYGSSSSRALPQAILCWKDHLIPIKLESSNLRSLGTRDRDTGWSHPTYCYSRSKVTTSYTPPTNHRVGTFGRRDSDSCPEAGSTGSPSHNKGVYSNMFIMPKKDGSQWSQIS